MDEIDGMYDDMQERLYEVDKSRKNNLVFYGVPQQNSDEDPDETERLIKSIITTKLQVMIDIFWVDQYISTPVWSKFFSFPRHPGNEANTNLEFWEKLLAGADMISILGNRW